jgi:hypothetical protein
MAAWPGEPRPLERLLGAASTGATTAPPGVKSRQSTGAGRGVSWLKPRGLLDVTFDVSIVVKGSMEIVRRRRDCVIQIVVCNAPPSFDADRYEMRVDGVIP